MNTKSIIEIFRGDDSDALGYQTIVGTIHTDLDLAGCKAVFRYLGFFQEFDPIPEDGKLTIVIPAASSIQFPPGLGYASLKVYDIDRKVRTFTNRIPVFVSTKTPCRCGGEFDVEFSPFPELEPLKIFIGPNADDYDLYTGFVMKIIDRASAEKYGLSMIYDDMDSDMDANSGVAASPVAVKAAYDAILGMLADNYYNKKQTDEQIDKLAAYYITSDAQGHPFATHAELVNATTYYSGGSVRTPTRNDYAIVMVDETHNNEEWRYIYAKNDHGVGRWEPQYAVEGVIAFDDYVTKTSGNAVKSSGIWSAIWGALASLPTGFTSLYDWIVAQLAGKASTADATLTPVYSDVPTFSKWTILRDGVDVTSQVQQPAYGNIVEDVYGWTCPVIAGDNPNTWYAGINKSDAISLSWSTTLAEHEPPPTFTYTATRTRTDILGYVLGAQTDKPLASEAEAEALRTEKAGKPARFFANNLAALDANGNLKDSTIVAANVAVKGEIPYTLVTKTIDNGAVTLDDRASNSVTVSATLSPNTLTINFPTAPTGKLRDFAMRLNIAAGVTAPEIAWPQGVTLENNGGEVPEIADGGMGGSSTILYFSESENNGTTAKFTVKGEALTAITQA